jgi:hypothetical protein
LRNIGDNVKEAFPELIHTKSAMSGVAVLQKGLHKNRQVPVAHKKQNYY